MKKSIKKLISVILSIVIVMSCTTTSLAFKKDEIRSSLSITISTDKKMYKKNETVPIHVTIKNNSEKSYSSVKLNMSYNSFKLNSAEGSSITINSLKAGEIKTVDFNVSRVSPSFGFKLIFNFFKVAAWTIRNILGFNSDAIKDYIWIGGTKYLFVFSITDGKISEDGASENVDSSKIDYTDSDGDGLADFIEIEYGSDPYSVDTDGDGLSDYWELNWLNLDPTKEDSNGNGISDAQEDTDGDSIKNIDEINIYGTNPALKDTDNDFLSDYEEIFVYKTDPLKEDTDEDGIWDGDEINNGTDPLTPETSFVSEKNLGEPTESIPVVASAKVIGDAESVGTLEIDYVHPGSDVRLSKTIPGYLGYAYSFSIGGTMISAEITFTYDESLGKISNSFQPRIYYFNENNQTLEELENQQVSEGKVTATVTHFSTYILLNKVEFDKVWETEIKPTDYQADEKNGIDIVFAIDSSGSMDWNDSTSLRKTVVKNFVDKLGNNDRAAIVDFDSSARIYQGFTTDHDLLYIATDKVDSSGGTSLSAGMKASIDLFTNEDYIRTDAYKYIVFLTDGDGDYTAKYTTQANDNNIVVYTIGLGDGVIENVLSQIATGTGGKYYFASTATFLPEIYEDISYETVDYSTDSNNDGISDYYTKLICAGDLVLSTGSQILLGTDFNYNIDGELSDDYDGDGLKNGEEITVVTKGNKVYIEMISNPLIPDSDFDGYDDYEEVKNMKTDPLKTTKEYSPLNILADNERYTYWSAVNDESFLNSFASFVAKKLDWSKTKDSKETIISYFYEYASADTIKDNAEAIAKNLNDEKFIEAFETVVNVIKTLQNIIDAGTTEGYDVSEVKALKDECILAKDKSLKTKDSSESIKVLSSSLKFVSSSENAILSATKKWSSVTKDLSGMVKNAVSLCKTLNEEWVLPLPKALSNFSNKYQAWSKNYGSIVSVAFDVVDLGTEVVSLKNTYGKIMANAQAYENYIELINYIARNQSYEKYIRNAANELYDIVIDTSWNTYYSKIDTAIAKETAKTAASLAFDVIGNFCPYVKAAGTIYDVAKATFSLTGVSQGGKDNVYLEMIVALSEGCVKIVDEKISLIGNYFNYEADDTDIYLIQLAQSRIVGERGACDLVTRHNLGKWLQRLLNVVTISDMNKTYGTIIDGIYYQSNKLDLTLSGKLPIYKNNSWTILEKT